MSRTRSQRGRARGRISGRLAHLWADIRASTDPGFLAAARYLGLLYGRIDRRLPIDQALRKALDRRLAPHVGWRHALGGITYLLFALLVATGVLLSFYYRPSAEEAYASIQHIVSEVSLGWLVRDLHVWASNLIVVAILAHMARVFFARAYRPPRETSWTVGLLLLLVVLAFGATGYLLPWDSWAFWTANEVVSRLAGVPLVGAAAARLLAGETFVAGATVSRFFVIHAIILPWIAFGLLAFHFALIRKHGVAPPEGPPAEPPGVPFYPNHLLRSFMTSVLVLSVAITLAALYPRPIGDPVAAFAEPSELVSTWIVVDVTLGLLRYVGPWGLVLYTLLGLSLLLIPLVDRRPEPRSRRRIVVTAVGLLFFLGFLGAWVAGAYGQARAQQPGDGLDASYGCIVCHAEKRQSFVQGVHSERGIRCHDCHGGDPAAFETAAAHSGDFRGAPGKRETVELCASCHSDPDRMRPFGVPTDQLAEFRASRHGQLLLGRGNTDAPSCTGCHDAHTILPPDDARSSVYPTAVAATCARCHQDQELMRPYGLRTDEAKRYRESAHGVGLFEHRNFAAPTCAGCHGSHGALPPDVNEVADVCGRCHVLVRRTFDEGRHGRSALGEEAPACTGCHDNHSTEPVPPDRIEASCRSCHDEDSDASLAGLEIQRRLLRATQEMVSAEEAIQELVRAGWRTTDIRFRYQAALTEYLQMPLVQHGLDLERLEALGLRVSSMSREVRAAAEVAAERRWERKLLLVPVWFLALAGIALAGFRLRSLGRGGPQP